jgi:outer membrane protein assembly factor BamB
MVVAASDDGTVVGLDARDGRPVWQQTGLGELTLAPAVVDAQVVVADAFTLHTFGLRDGRRGPRLQCESVLSSAPVAAEGKLFVGDQTGVIHVLDPETLRRRYALGGKGRISAPLGVGRAGQALAAFESKILQGFRQLP